MRHDPRPLPPAQRNTLPEYLHVLVCSKISQDCRTDTNEDFAVACAVLAWFLLASPANAIRAMGLKAESKQLMEKAACRWCPGYHGAGQDPAMLHKEVRPHCYLVLIKASAGGGKGMRLVEKTEDLRLR